MHIGNNLTRVALFYNPVCCRFGGAMCQFGMRAACFKGAGPICDNGRMSDDICCYIRDAKKVEWTGFDAYRAFNVRVDNRKFDHSNCNIVRLVVDGIELVNFEKTSADETT